MPNIISLVALFLSWISVVILLNNRFYLSFSVILIAFIMDALDGYIARRLKKESSFGRQLDGYVDVFVFLIYPALSFYLFFGLRDVISIIIVFIYIAAGVLRLARFNVTGFITVQNKEHLSYSGLPVFFNHLTILILLALNWLPVKYFVPIAGIIILLNSLLMVLKFQFPKPRSIWPFVLLLLLVSCTMFYLEIYANR
jgi:phosphatidylserine synthase